MKIFLSRVADLGGPEDIEIEVLPESGVEREAKLTRLRTEIMAGEGPDIFIMACDTGTSSDGVDVLFPIPEKAMESGLFLTLDEYIENAQFMEWDKLTPAVMEAGRNEYGQQILPLTYTFPVTFYYQSEVSHEVSKEATWEDMLADESKVLTSAAAWIHTTEEEYGLYTLQSWEKHYLECILGDLANYEEEKLLFTEKELLQRTEEILDLRKQYLNGEYTEYTVVSSCFQDALTIGFNDVDAFWSFDRFNGMTRTEVFTMIPLYSDDGGVTANIMYYAAISCNTKRPEDAFFILDVLMEKTTQQRSEIYKWFSIDEGVPMHEDLLQEEYPTRYMGEWYLSDNNYAELCEIRDNITSAHFQGGLDLVLDKMFEEYYYAVIEDQAKSKEEIVSNAYREMEIMLRE